MVRSTVSDITPEKVSPRREEHQRYYKKNRDRLLADSRARHAANPERTWEKDLKRKFGITVAQYNELLLKQGGKCAICKGDQVNGRKRLDVDHCHRTQKVRGLLCGFCNRAVGMLKDDLSLAEKLTEYLRSQS
jgi:hypothetical protein